MVHKRHKLEHLRELRKRLIAGEKVEVLAAELGVSVSRMHGLWGYYGLVEETPIRISHKISTTALREIHREWMGGRTMSSLAKQHSIPASTIRNMLKAAGLELVRTNGIPSNGGYRGPATIKQRTRWMVTVHTMREKGVTWPKIHQKLSSEDYPSSQTSLRKMYTRWLVKIKEAKQPIPTLQ